MARNKRGKQSTRAGLKRHRSRLAPGELRHQDHDLYGGHHHQQLIRVLRDRERADRGKQHHESGDKRRRGPHEILPAKETKGRGDSQGQS